MAVSRIASQGFQGQRPTRLQHGETGASRAGNPHFAARDLTEGKSRSPSTHCQGEATPLEMLGFVADLSCAGAPPTAEPLEPGGEMNLRTRRYRVAAAFILGLLPALLGSS